eukprot:5891247-Prymnesium_polylepis.3
MRQPSSSILAETPPAARRYGLVAGTGTGTATSAHQTPNPSWLRGFGFEPFARTAAQVGKGQGAWVPIARVSRPRRERGSATAAPSWA